MSEIVERVSCALEVELSRQDDEAIYGLIDDLALVDFAKLAQVAIRAMREPTEAMRVAGMDAISDEMHDSTEPRDFITTFEAGEGFRAMIDAALEDGK